jgi:hypothetical protein
MSQEVAPAVSLVRPYVATPNVGRSDTDSDTSPDSDMSHVPTATPTQDVAAKVAKTDRKMSRPVSRPSDTDKVKTARRRVARGDSCAAVARDIDVTAKTVERWTKDIREARAAATPATNGHRPDIDLTGVSS